MPGRFDSIVLPLDQGFRNQNHIIMVVFCYVPIYFPVYFNSLCWDSNCMGLIREFQLGRLQGDAGEIRGRLLGDSWEIGSYAKKSIGICISHLPDLLREIRRLQQYNTCGLGLSNPQNPPHKKPHLEIPSFGFITRDTAQNSTKTLSPLLSQPEEQTFIEIRYINFFTILSVFSPFFCGNSVDFLWLRFRT